MGKPDYPPAAFTPTMLGYTGQGAFRYWCQTALPLVYDDSLSYYELLNKVVVYLNNVISDVSNTETNVESLLTAYNQLQEYVNTYFNGIDIQNEINTKLDEMASSGELTELISPLIPELVSAWLQENITPTTPTVDKTLRISDAAADSLVTGITTEKNKFYGLSSGVNLTNVIDFTIVEDSYIDKNNGSIVSYTGWNRTDYVEVPNYKTVYIYSITRSEYCYTYDENKNPLFQIIITKGLNKLSLPMTVKYLMLSGAERSLTIRTCVIFTSDNALIQNGFRDKFLKNSGDIKFYNGTLTSTGAYEEAFSRIVSDFIEVPHQNCEVRAKTSQWHFIITEYDENKNMVFQQPTYPPVNRNIDRTMSPTTKYIRILLKNSADSDSHVTIDDLYASGVVFDFVALPDMISITSYNVGHYAYGTGMGIPIDDNYENAVTGWRRYMSKYRTDVIACQEYDTWMNAAASSSTAKMAWDELWKNFFDYSRTTGDRTAILSRYISTWSRNGQLSTGRYYTFFPINGIAVYSVHLSVGVGNESVRLSEAAEIVNLAKQHDRYIICGDFNCEPGEETALFKVFSDAGMNVGNVGYYGKYYTWSNPRSNFDHYDTPDEGSKLYYIDNIITSPGLKIVTFEPIPSAFRMCTSDHIPVIAEIRIS